MRKINLISLEISQQIENEETHNTREIECKNFSHIILEWRRKIKVYKSFFFAFSVCWLRSFPFFCCFDGTDSYYSIFLDSIVMRKV